MVSKKKERIVLLDVLRGILIVWVMVDHFLYDCGYLFYASDYASSFGVKLHNFATRYWNGNYREIAHFIVLLLFFVLSGVVESFSRRPLFRTVKLAVIAVLMWLGTWAFSEIFNENATITFGVIYVFSVCSLFGYLISKCKIPLWVTLIVGTVLTVVGLMYCYGKLNFMSEKLYFLVFDDIGYGKSADYFPLLPYLGYYLFGIVIGKLFYKDKKPYVKVGKKVEKALSPISFMGRTSLWWYLISQVAFFALLYGLISIGVL